MTKVITVIDKFAGPTKSYFVRNVGHVISELNKKVLLIDMSPKVELSQLMFSEEDLRELKSDVSMYLLRGEDEDKRIIEVSDNLHVLLGNTYMLTIEDMLVKLDNLESLLKNSIDAIEGYDYIIINAPASSFMDQPLLAQQCVETADKVITVAPVIPNATNVIGSIKDLIAISNNKDVDTREYIVDYGNTKDDLDEVIEALRESNYSTTVIPEELRDSDELYEELPIVISSPNNPISIRYKEIANELVNEDL